MSLAGYLIGGFVVIVLIITLGAALIGPRKR
jgi:hypothetical protein